MTPLTNHSKPPFTKSLLFFIDFQEKKMYKHKQQRKGKK